MADTSISIDPNALREGLLDFLGKDGAGREPLQSLFKSLVGKAQLTAEQESLLSMVLDRADEAANAAPEQSQDTRALEKELADLREANDTVAAALGACPLCWGGDRRCEACGGEGRAGHVAPDPALFKELVIPAVERLSAMKRARDDRSNERRSYAVNQRRNDHDGRRIRHGNGLRGR
jgi:hypothetical protein